MTLVVDKRLRPLPPCALVPWEGIQEHGYWGASPMELFWRDVRDYRGDAWIWWASETHVLANPFTWRPVPVDQLSITEDPATWRGTHVVWIGK